MADHTNDDVFLAEKVVDSGFGQQDGKRYYKIKWVRYTWESEDTIGHLKELLDAFWSEHEKLDDAKAKSESVSVEMKELDTEKINTVDSTNENSVDGTLAANTTIGDDSIPSGQESGLAVNILLKSENQGNELSNTRISDDGSNLSPNGQNIPSSLSNQEVTNFEGVDNKEVKFIMLEKHTCDVCLRSYSSLQSLKTHKRSHQSDKKFECDVCFKCFSERSTLKRHMYIHLDEKPFKCEHCERAFSDKSTLRRHIITHTGAKRFQCTSCDKRFTRNEHLRQHNYIHTAQKLYKCKVCGKDFRQRSTLKNHMLLHRAEGALKCDACCAVFSRQLQYDKHIRWCNGDTSEGYKCEFCTKRFPDRNGLKRHQLIHSGERPFKCDHCEQSFNDRSILRRHILTHTEKKPFQCSVCQKEFSRKSSLLSHMSSQHAEQPVFEFVQPAGYGINDGITIGDEEMGEHVRFVIQNSASPEVNDPISQVEVSTSNVQSDGVTMLAHAVCNIPHVITHAGDSPSVISGLSVKSEEEMNQDMMCKNENQTLRIQVGQESGISTGENQLLQVQIIRMGDGNQFVQSIQTIVQPENKECESETINITDDQVMNPSSQLAITSDTGEGMRESIDSENKDFESGKTIEDSIDTNINKETEAENHEDSG